MSSLCRAIKPRHLLRFTAINQSAVRNIHTAVARSPVSATSTSTTTCQSSIRPTATPRLIHTSTANMSSSSSSPASYEQILSSLGLSSKQVNAGCFNGSEWVGSGEVFTSVNPANQEVIGQTRAGTKEELEQCMVNMEKAKAVWAEMPLPVRGEIVRQIGDALRVHKQALGELISAEMGKILSEGLGEVQEAIDICDYAVGLSRTLNGSILPSERPGHFMMERWNPLKGHVGIISAFNFPCAVFFWNAAISFVCGNTNLWKGADTTSLVTIASTKIIADVFKKNNVPAGVITMCQGSGPVIGEQIINDKRFELISFTGSTKVGKRVSEVTAQRFGKKILELGGNNAMVILEDADLNMALRACLFSAVGTAGQRCTTLRRLYLHESIHDKFVEMLAKCYGSIKIGDPREAGVLCGPLHTAAGVKAFEHGVAQAVAQGGKIVCGGKKVENLKGNFVQPTLITMENKDAEIVKEEIFVPILYVMKINSLDEGIALNNNVPQGLSSSLFTKNQQAIFKWTGAMGSDCGIVNVNIGPSGAEIGGAFGGEKDTGGGRESGSDSWKQYMRRSTCTVNYSNNLPLAQGVNFDIGV